MKTREKLIRDRHFDKLGCANRSGDILSPKQHPEGDGGRMPPVRWGAAPLIPLCCWFACTLAVLAAQTGLCQETDPAAIARAFESLQSFDWGSDRGPIDTLDRIVLASHGDAELQKALEPRLIAVVAGKASQAAKGIACRQLSFIGTAESVPALAALLTDAQLSHMGRYALQRMPCDEAGQAIRDAVAKTDGKLKIGLINSLGERRDAANLPLLSGLLADQDPAAVSAAAAALGKIGSSDAAEVLTEALGKVAEDTRPAVADACLVCAERLLANKQKAEAVALYRKLAAAELPKHLKLAATRGMLAAMQ